MTNKEMAQALESMAQLFHEVGGTKFPWDDFIDGFKQGRETGDILPRPVKCDGSGILTADYSSREYLESIEHEGCCDFCPAVDADRDCNDNDCIQSVVNMWLEHKVFGGPYGLEDDDDE